VEEGSEDVEVLVDEDAVGGVVVRTGEEPFPGSPSRRSKKFTWIRTIPEQFNPRLQRESYYWAAPKFPQSTSSSSRRALSPSEAGW